MSNYSNIPQNSLNVKQNQKMPLSKETWNRFPGKTGHKSWPAKRALKELIKKSKEVSPYGKLVADQIIDYYNENRGYAWPPNQHMAESLGVSERSIRRLTNRLHETGLIYKEDVRGRSKANRYYPRFDLVIDPETGDLKTGQSEENRTLLSENRTLESSFSSENRTLVSPYTLHTYRRDTEGMYVEGSAPLDGSPNGSTVSGLPDGFEDFWAAYPKRENRAEAIEAYEVALSLPGITPDLLADKAAQYAKAKEGTKAQFIKFPHNWLKEERWTDDPQSQQAKKSSKKPLKPSKSPSVPSGEDNSWMALVPLKGSKPPEDNLPEDIRPKPDGPQPLQIAPAKVKFEGDLLGWTHETEQPLMRNAWRKRIENSGLSEAVISRVVGLGDKGLHEWSEGHFDLSERQVNSIMDLFDTAIEWLKLTGKIATDVQLAHFWHLIRVDGWDNENILNAVHQAIRSKEQVADVAVASAQA